MAYVTTANLKVYLDISEDRDDTLLGSLLDSATEAIDNYTKRTFAVASDTTRYFDALGDHIKGYRLDLDEDLAAITTVTNGDGVVVSSSEYTPVLKNDPPYFALQILSQAGKIWTYSSEWMNAIEIVGKWGFSVSGSEPADILQACRRLAAFYYKQRDAALFDVSAIEGGAVIQPQGIPLDVRKLLDPYRVKL